MNTEKPVEKLTDDELFDEIRHQVNQSRNLGTHNRERTRAIAAEMKRRGWTNTPKP